MKNVSSNSATVPVTELPDAVRIPLHSLQADLEYLIGRVIADGSCGPMIVKSMRERLDKIEAGLPVPARPDVREALEPFAEVAEMDIGIDESDNDIFRPMRSGYNRAPLITVGDMRRALQAVKEDK